MTRRAARTTRAGCWAALVVGLAGRTAWSAPEDDLPDPPISAAPPTPPPAPPVAAPQAAPKTASPSSSLSAPAPSRGPVPWPTVPGAAGPPASGGAPPAPEGSASSFPGPVPQAAPAPPPAPTGEHTSIGAYGEALVSVDRDRDVTAALPWLVVSLDHRPTPWLRFYAEAELEQATHFGMEQAFLQLSPHPAFGVRAGLLVLPLGIINQWHEPPTFLTTLRPLTDELIIPTTWRELGVGLYGALGADARFDLQVVAGLDAAGFSAAAPLWGGRGNGEGIAAHDAAVVGRLELGRLPSGFALGGGGYWGGASGGHPELATVSVGLGEADARFRGAGFDLRAEIAELFIVNSYRVNDYLGLLGQDAVPARGRGFYAQAGYDVLATDEPGPHQELLFFAGYENVNPRSQMSPYNFNPATITPAGQPAPNAPSAAKAFLRGGIDYRPRPALAFKADVQVALDAEGPAAAPPQTVMGAPGTPRALRSDVAEAARGKTRVGFAFAFMF